MILALCVLAGAGVAAGTFWFVRRGRRQEISGWAPDPRAQRGPKEWWWTE